MDLKHTTTTTSAAAAPDSPDTDGETPLCSQQIQPFSSFPNGKKHHHHRPPPSTVVAYKECLKNHAATIGSHALDGCGEFMPSPTPTPQDPTSLKCAACGCHRNFHRRDTAAKTHFIEFHHPSSPPHQPTNYAYACAPHVLMSLGSADQNHMVVATPGTPAAIKIENPHGRKRFRTKFSQEQKEKMYLFADKMGWKMQRCDDKKLADFCNEIGIRRGIFKVWMHNNKNTFGKKDKDTTSPTTTPVAVAVTSAVTTVTGGRVVSSDQSHEEQDVNVNVNRRNCSDQENAAAGGGGGGSGGSGDTVHLQASANGSSSSC